MSVAPTFPGVYIEEISSGVRAITGVATSITAFVGRAARGPVDGPRRINSFADYERIYGGLSVDSTLSYAVKQFYQNGGSAAIIVRLINAGAASTITLITGTQTLIAKKAGAWGNNLTATVANDPDNPSLFDLVITGTGTGNIETFTGVSVDPDSDRAVDKVLAADSLLVNWQGALTGNRPDPVADKVSNSDGSDAAVAATITLEAGVGTQTLVAKSPGLWGNKLTAGVSVEDASKRLLGPNLFNLIITDTGTGNIERFLNVSVDPASNRAVDKVLAAESQLVDWQGALSGSRPVAVTAKASNNNGADGSALTDTEYLGNRTAKTGIYQLEKVDLFNLLCIPPISRTTDVGSTTLTDSLAYCAERRAMLILDPPVGWTTKDLAVSGMATFPLAGVTARNAALYFPRLRMPDALLENRLDNFAPCGAVAGVMARTDSERGVWKAPAGQDASLSGVTDLSVSLTDLENGELNPLGLNCLRSFPNIGRVVWGARTLRGADQLADEFKYVPVRRITLFIEESLYRGTKWVVFEPNDEPLWAQIRLNIGAFMQNLFRQGAFQGTTPRDAYFVKCDKETTTQSDINLGIVNIAVGFAPLKPAEFVIIKIQQIAGQIQA